MISPLDADINDITGISNEKKIFTIYAIIHTDTEDIDVPRVMRYSGVYDYKSKVAPIYNLDIQIGSSKFFEEVHKKRRKIEVSVIIDIDGDIDETRYRAEIPTGSNPNLSAIDHSGIKLYESQEENVLDISVSLWHREYEPMISKNIVGVIAGKGRKDAIVSVIEESFGELTVDGNGVIDGVDMVDPDNKDPLKQSIVPSFTRTIDLPTIIQENMGGLYMGGVGSFFQKFGDGKKWFIYPYIVNSEKSSASGDLIKIFVSPDSQNRATESTWEKSNKILTIVATAKKSYSDNISGSRYSEGVGFSSISAESMMDDSADVDSGSLVAHSARLNTIVGDKESPTGLPYSPKIRQKPNINTFSQGSRVKEADGGVINVTWENGDGRLIKPSMEAEVVMNEGGEAKKSFGRVIWHHDTYLPIGNNHTCNQFYSVSEIAIYTSTLDDDYYEDS